MTTEAFVMCASGLEPLLIQELEQLGIRKLRKGFRGVYVPRDMTTVYKINYSSRIAMRVLWPLATFPCHDDKALYGKARSIDWSLYLNPKKTFAIDANVSHPLLRSSLFAAQVLKDSLCDSLREKFQARPSVSTISPDVQLNLFIQKGWATISLDTSGAPLYRRGYRKREEPALIEKIPEGISARKRQELEKLIPRAPIQESLAAAILFYANYSEKDTLCDPCCGSGTFLIEAAMMATRTPAGFFRKSWGFMASPEFSEASWLRVKEAADKQIIPLSKGCILGADKDPTILKSCQESLEATGFNTIELQCQELNAFTPSIPPNLVICNPPYGKRLPSSPSLYTLLEDFVKNKCTPRAEAFILTPDTQALSECGLSEEESIPLNNGGIELELVKLRFR